MCTVVFIPAQGKYLIASLRDEHPNRSKAGLPILTHSSQKKYIAPIDPQGGGTWVGINDGGAAIVLLNGGFKNHIKKNCYARSRGQIVTELLSVNDPIQNWNNIELINIEPFTLIVWVNGHLVQLVWDGEKKYQTVKDTSKAHIWSSSTLCDENEKQTRSGKFEDWLNNSNDRTRASILEFFFNKQHFNKSIFIKNSAEIITHSYTCIELFENEQNTINYQDLFTEHNTSNSINKT
jgi:uncharacterized protein with NRDE domain